jgi:hypothetical protein
MGITREDYQANRLRLLSGLVNVSETDGLEIGACDLPTVPPGAGRCDFADFRTAEEMARLWNLPFESVMPVSYVLRRDEKVHRQIGRTFDYIVLCHVIEHVPNVIGYINDLRQLLNDGGVMFIACPDKRRTFDAPRPSTPIEHLLDDFFRDVTYPSLEHILEFGRTCSEEVRSKSETSVRDFFEWGRQNFESGSADVHCHVWTDEEFFAQARGLVNGGILARLDIIRMVPNEDPFNEFHLAFRAVGDDKGEAPPRGAAAVPGGARARGSD